MTPPAAWRRWAFLAGSIAAITALHFAYPTRDHTDHIHHVLFRGLYLLPLLAAAVWFELWGALLATAAVIGVYSLHILLHWRGVPWENANQIGMLAIYAVFGLAAGLLSRREAQLREAKKREEQRLHRQLVLQSLAALSQALKWRDTPTREHSEAVGRLAARVAGLLGLDRERIEIIRLAGTVHDIGKIGIADDVLLKPGSLTPEERRTMEIHPEVAADILRPIPGTEQIAEIVRGHHELLDGSGYPKGRSGDAIPLETRIVTAADIYVALSERRPYKEPLRQDEILEMMRTMTPGKLDARVFAALETAVSTG